MLSRWSLLFGFAIAVGCGQSSSPEPSPVVAPVEPSGTAKVAPAPPLMNQPSQFELPGVIDPSTMTDKPAATSPAGSGLEMPPLESTDSPVIVQRPVLDESVGREVISSPAISLSAATWPEIQQRIASTGKVCVVDLWSLSCEPCLKEFPGLVKLHDEYGDDVVCFAVSVDFDGRKTKPAEMYRPRVEAFLASMTASLESFLSVTPSEELFENLNIPSIPAVLVYDQTGALVRKFVDAGDDVGFGYERNVVPLVKALLKSAQ